MGGAKIFDQNVLLLQNTKRGRVKQRQGPKTKIVANWKMAAKTSAMAVWRYSRYKIEEVLAARIHELEVCLDELFGELVDDDSKADDIHGQIQLDDYGII
jgi:hypothetical protein